jgi:hypothetical protein
MRGIESVIFSYRKHVRSNNVEGDSRAVRPSCRRSAGVFRCAGLTIRLSGAIVRSLREETSVFHIDWR